MSRSLLLLAAAGLSIPLAATAQAATQPAINCKSAREWPAGLDFKTYAAFCDAQAAAERAKLGRTSAAAGGSIQQNLTTPDLLNFQNVPVWSDADIAAQFAATRDARYMTTASNPSFQRRISWMYPDDGCFARAEQVDVRVAQAGKTRPYKLFAMSVGLRLRVFTSNTDDVSGTVHWNWHVVPVVKNPAGQVIVLDAALSPCRPLPYKEWLALMTSDPTAEFSDPVNGHGVGLGDSNAYVPSSLVSGEPSHSADSLSDETQFYLNDEWSRQTALGRDPNTVLGNTPPWSGFNCVAMTAQYAESIVANGATATVTATCPYATLAVGGGFNIGSPSVTISKDARSGNAWQVVGKNNSGSSSFVDSYAYCLIGAPSNATIASVQGSVVNVNPSSSATSTASCSSGKLVGGGYTTTQGTSTVMRIYNNGRTTSTGSTWQVSAQNTTSTAKSVTSFAYCLQNTSLSVAQKTSTGADSSGIAGVACSFPAETLAGGGWVFPRTTAYTVQSTSVSHNNAYFVQLVPPPVNGDANAKAFVECISHP